MSVCLSVFTCPSSCPVLVSEILLLCRGRGVEYCDQFVCLYVCLSVCVCLSVHEHISGTTALIFMQIPCDCGLVLIQRSCTTLCTSGFMDDITFGRNGRDAQTWRLHRAATAMTGVVIPGRSLMSMNACCLIVHILKIVPSYLTLSSPVVSNVYTSKCSESYWSNPPFLIF